MPKRPTVAPIEVAPVASADLLYVVTCRAEPNDPNIHNHVPMAAGHYQQLLVQHVPAGANKTGCDCFVCPDSPPFQRDAAMPPLPTGDIIIVVHGFNCTEETGLETAYHTRQLLNAWGLPTAPATESQSTGQPHLIAFTWPCEHSLFPGYMADKEAVARFGAFSLANLITDLRHLEPTRKIHIIAHSMGCFLTLKALNMLAILHRRPPHAPVPLLVDLVMWLAPDINADALERSTPAALQERHWHAIGALPKAHHLLDQLHTLTSPEPRADAAMHPHQTLVRDDRENYLDGYGYAALNVVRQVAIYSSLRDEAMWVSPLANHFTEEGGSASQGVRLGWCGPLHPERLMEPDSDAADRQRYATLVECTPVVSEHGDYFYLPVVQRDITQRVLQAQAYVPDLAPEPFAGEVTPFPECVLLDQWLEKTPLVYPAAGQTVAPGLTMVQLRPTEKKLVGATVARAGAPSRTSSPTSFLWNTPLHVVGDVIVQVKRFHSLILGVKPE